MWQSTTPPSLPGIPKYTYNRSRPAALDPTLSTAVATPASPSYPSEHAVVAGAAATVLAYAFPDDAQALMARAQEAADSRVEAGVQFASDSSAGLELDCKVGELVVERGKNDGISVPWAGTMPNTPGLWSLAGYPEGATPAAANFGALRPWVLDSPSQLRPGPPPAAGSEQKLAELGQIKDVPRYFPLTHSASTLWVTKPAIRASWPAFTSAATSTRAWRSAVGWRSECWIAPTLTAC